jgi:hypothetical protein
MRPSGRTSSAFSFVLNKPAEVELHLALVVRAEGALLQLDHYQSLQLSVVEQEVDVEVLSVNLDALLTADKGKADP